MFQRHKLRYSPPGGKITQSHFPISAVAAAWKGVIKSATEVEGSFSCLTFRAGKKYFGVPQFQLR